MQYFYVEDLSAEYCTLSAEESAHVVRVLRKSAGAELWLTDGGGALCRAAVVEPDARGCGVQVVERRRVPQPQPMLHLAVAPTKNEARMEWLVEKATEVGISEITPLLCDRSEREHVHEARLRKIALSAMKQSLKTYLPRINGPSTLDAVVRQAAADEALERYVCYCEGEDRVTFRQSYTPGRSAIVLIGPEGDFSPREVDVARAAGFTAVTLGNTRLRTETAALAATFYMQFLNE